MQVPLFDSYSNHQPSGKQHVGVIQVVFSRVLGAEHAKGREEDEREKCSDGDWDHLCHPEYGNDRYGVGGFGSLCRYEREGGGGGTKLH